MFFHSVCNLFYEEWLSLDFVYAQNLLVGKVLL